MRRVAVLSLLVLLSGCAITPAREYRSGVFLHRQPTYSFRVPDAWRPATEDDISSFASLRPSMMVLTTDPQLWARETARDTFRKSDSVLISEHGAVMVVQSQRNTAGVLIPRENSVTEKEKATIVRAVMDSAEKDKDFTVQSADLVSYGRTPALKINARRAGVIPVRMIMVTSRSHMVMVLHMGVPGDDDEALSGLEELATSFQFE